MLELVREYRPELAGSGARHGLGAFETIRMEEGRPLLLDRHLRRLSRGCRLLGLDAPPEAQEIRAFLKGDPAPALPSAALRLLALDGVLEAVISPLPPPPPMPVTLLLSETVTRLRGEASTTFKCFSYLNNILLAREAASAGAFDALALNEAGRISDGGRSSLFAVLGGKILTPPTSEGALPGVVRSVLLESGLAQEAPLEPADLDRAESLFVTNALTGILPVEVLRRKGVPDRVPPGVHSATEEAREALRQAWRL